MELARSAIVSLYDAGDIPDKATARKVWAIYQVVGEDTPEALCTALDAVGIDGTLAFEVWGEW